MTPPALAIIDAHVHFYDAAINRYPVFAQAQRRLRVARRRLLTRILKHVAQRSETLELTEQSTYNKRIAGEATNAIAIFGKTPSYREGT
jgi:hypothetical protein